MSLTIGVDVGGTNTDVAIVSGNNVIGWSKSPTTNKIIDGIITAIQHAISSISQQINIKHDVQRINIGTTHFINAVIKRKNLSTVSCIRLCGPSTHSLPPFTSFPEDLLNLVNGGYFLLNGGFEFNQEVITELDENEIVEKISIIKQSGVKHVVVTGVFSPTNAAQEKFVGDLLQKNFPECSFTLSHLLGPLGLLERENASILNESLKELCDKTITGFKSAFHGIGLSCPVFFTQNDGTLISESEVKKFPVHTFSSGATNSMRGATHLSSLKDAIIVDIGGTSTDVGAVVKGFPRESSTRVEVGGVITNFRMPDTKSYGLGGGSIVTIQEDNSILVGPSSVEYRITQEALVFGGSTLVSSDIAVANGCAKLGKQDLVKHLDKNFVARTMEIIRKKIEMAVDTVKLSKEACNVVLVGGGSILIDTKETFAGVSCMIKPQFYQVANAVGAALSQVSGDYDKLVTFDHDKRQEVIDSAKQEAMQKAVANGALIETCHIVDVSEVAMSYMAVPCVRLKVKVVGDLEHRGGENESYSINTDLTQDKNIDISCKETVAKDSEPLHQRSSKEQPPSACTKETQQPEYGDDGEWILNERDVDCLAIGAGVLGCGGGGSPYIGHLGLKRLLKNGKRPRIKSPLSMKENERALGVAFMGAPEILIERLPSGHELLDSMSLFESLVKMEFHSDTTANKSCELIKKNHLDAITSSDASRIAFKVSDIPPVNLMELTHSVITVLEIGGMNSLEPLILAAQLGIPVLDCDGMGRAFPQLQHFSPFIYGTKPYPAVIVSHKNEGFCCVGINSATDLENFFRECCVKFGCSAAICFSLSKNDVMNKTCHNTLSQAWHIGNAVLNARSEHLPPVDAILKISNGMLLCHGKISNLERTTKDGFTKGKIDVDVISCHTSMVIEFQNEYLIARNSKTSAVLATCPDLITLVETDNGHPITSDELKYGLRVSVLVIPSNPLMSSKRALEFVAPEAFHYNNVVYKSIGEHVSVVPIPKIDRKEEFSLSSRN